MQGKHPQCRDGIYARTVATCSFVKRNDSVPEAGIKLRREFENKYRSHRSVHAQRSCT